ncbi:response regulator [Lichenicola cladoniae]
MGYRCVGYASAEAGLTSGHAQAADCIVTDIHMPGLDGFDLKQKLDARGSSGRVIMMTGRSDSRLELRAQEAGAFCLLRKPLHAGALAACLSRALGKSTG